MKKDNKISKFIALPNTDFTGNVGDYTKVRVLRGTLHDGLAVKTGRKIGDIDHRCKPEPCFTISDKATDMGGAVLEAILYHVVREYR